MVDKVFKLMDENFIYIVFNLLYKNGWYKFVISCGRYRKINDMECVFIMIIEINIWCFGF